MPSFIGVRHVGLAAKNPAVLAEFYRNVMGMTVVGSRFGASVFLGAHHEEEDHEMVFFDNPTAAHTAFRVASLGDLQTFYRQVKGRACRSRLRSIMAARWPSILMTQRGI